MGREEQLFPMKHGTEFPNMGDAPLPVEPYISREFFEREREKIFKRAWLQVARVEDIPNPGDYLVRKLEVLKASVIIVRGQDHKIRAFHNICTHRGNKVALHDKGNARNFVCGFHGWVFGTDGALKMITGKEYFPDYVDECKLGLKPLACDTWNGFVFVHHNPNPPQGLREYLGGMGEQVDGYPFADLVRIATYDTVMRANWKVAMDAFNESYHVPTVHLGSLPGSASSESNPASVPTSVRFHGPHRSMTPYNNPAYMPPHTALVVGKYGPTFVTEKGRYPGTNPNDDEGWWFDANIFFPNFVTLLGAGWYLTYNFWPLSENLTRWQMNVYQPRAKNAGAVLANEHTRVHLRDTLLEDFGTVEHTQEMMESGVLESLTISDPEVEVRHQLWTVNRWLAQP